jgi:hypothetical protein
MLGSCWLQQRAVPQIRRIVSEEPASPFFNPFDGAVCYSETSVTIYHTAQLHDFENLNVGLYWCSNANFTQPLDYKNI